MSLRDELVKASNVEIGSALADTYSDIVEHFVLQRWKFAGLDTGHFVEASRRFLELKLFSTSTPISKQLTNFNQKALASYESASGDIAYRMLIPKTLWSLYSLRNKRSIGHLGAVPASEIDASFLLNGAKWVLAEILRLESDLDVDGTRKIVSEVISRQQPAIWKGGGVNRVLDNGLEAREKTLVLLALVGDMTEDELRKSVGYKNPTNFRKILKRLDASNFISYSSEKCEISPIGTMRAESLVAGQ